MSSMASEIRRKAMADRMRLEQARRTILRQVGGRLLDSLMAHEYPLYYWRCHADEMV